MDIDSTQPWVETTPKKPKYGEVLAAIIDVQTEAAGHDADVDTQLATIDKNVAARIKQFETTVATKLTAHTSKKGLVHGETKATIGLSKKENLSAADAKAMKTLVDDDSAKKKIDPYDESVIFPHTWVTPKVLSVFLHSQLDIQSDTYIEKGKLPISAGRILGKTLTNQQFLANELTYPITPPSGQVSYLLSGEENYILFAEFGQGRVTHFHQGGDKAPIGVNNVDVHDGNIYVSRGQAISANHLTMKRDGSKATDATQEVETALFDPAIVYTSKGTLYGRNANTTKHFFNELSVKQNGKYPFTHVVFLSRDRFLSYFANTRLAQQNNQWGILIDIVTGDVGIPDWYPDTLTRNTPKILSKQSTLVVQETRWDNQPITGYDGAKTISQSAIGSTTDPKYLSLFIPINSFIKGFNTLSSTLQKTLIDNVDTDLLVRLTVAWKNEHILNGVLRLPFYYTVPNTTDAWNTYLDVEFTFTQTQTGNQAGFASYNFLAENAPTIGTTLQLTLTDTTRFTKWSQSVADSPYHPKVFRGCFDETGGHLTAYNAGHRQYVCYYKHDITSVKEWILGDLTPATRERWTRVVDVGMMPGNRFYSDNTRIVPVMINDDTITYLTRARNHNGKYAYGTFTIPNDGTFSLPYTRTSQSSHIRWATAKVNTPVPLVVANVGFAEKTLSTTALVFSEANGFTGYQTHGFAGEKFTPSGVTTLDNALVLRIKLKADIVDPYMIFFYHDEVLYWSIASRSGTKNKDGKDVCVGGIRVDMLYDGTSYTIRPLPGMVMKTLWGVLYEDYPAGLIRGRECESFDDVFITSQNAKSATREVFINYPDLAGRYFPITLTGDADGYYYPSALNNTVLDLKKACGYGTTCPYVLFTTHFTPFMLPDKLYLPTQDLFAFSVYGEKGVSTVREDWVGWYNEQPLFVVGESIIINGTQHTLKTTLTISTVDKAHKGKVMVNYLNSTFNVYSSAKNELNYTTEPDNAAMFVGFLEYSGNNGVLTYHAPRGNSDIANQDFMNSLLPVIDGKQMCTESRGSTFPAMLGLVTDYPRQYFFKKS